jgi:hypothetical protein
LLSDEWRRKKSAAGALDLVLVKPSSKGSRRSRNPCIQTGQYMEKVGEAELDLVLIKPSP